MRRFIALLALTPALCRANPTFEIPAPGRVLPAKFSGTNCPASGQATIVGGYLVTVELWLKQGTLVERVASWSWTPGNAYVPVKSLAVRFASTHFEHGSDVEVYMRALDGGGAWSESPHVARPNVNVAALYEHPDFALIETGIEAGWACLETANHDTSDDHRGGAWTKSDVLTSLAQCTAAHIASHGQADGSFTSGAGENVTASDVLAARTSAEANGVPPINIILFDCCLLGQGQTALNSHYPTNPPPIDRAAVAFTIVVNSTFSPDYCDAFWGALQDFQTVAVAKRKLVDKYNEDPDVPHIGYDDVVVAGDPLSKIMGVYAPSGLVLKPEAKWFRND